MRRDSSRAAALAELEQRLGWVFRDRELLETALTHRSWANEREGAEHYERLEFLGDAVLGLVAAEWAFRRFPDRSEGELSREKAYVVTEAVLARYGALCGLGELLRVGVGEERSRGREKPSLLADAVEAVLGAIYLDGGLEPARRWALRLLEEAASWRSPEVDRDAKTALQELLQARGLDLPVYTVVAELGPDHDKQFTVEVVVAGLPAGRGEGRTKKSAEQHAAAAALAAFS